MKRIAQVHKSSQLPKSHGALQNYNSLQISAKETRMKYHHLNYCPAVLNSTSSPYVNRLMRINN